MEWEESGSSREHHLPPVKNESVIRVFVRPLHGISATGNEPAPLAKFLSELSLSLQCDASAPRELSFNKYLLCRRHLCGRHLLFLVEAVEDAARLDHAGIGVDVGLRRIRDH